MFRRQEIADKQYQEERPKMDVEEGMNGIGADPGGAQSRFSSTYRPNLKAAPGGEFLPEISAAAHETPRNSKQAAANRNAADTRSVDGKAAAAGQQFTRLS